MPKQFVCVFCKPPDQVTEAGHRFFEHHKENLGYVTFVKLLAERADELGELGAGPAMDDARKTESGALERLRVFAGWNWNSRSVEQPTIF